MKIITVVGARPNFMKVAPILTAIRRHNQALQTESEGAHESAPMAIQHILVHTGQHYDSLMSDSFFSDLQLQAPDIHLGIRPASASSQTAEILEKFSAVLLQEQPDAVIVVGDVNSTVACAFATAKMSFDSAGKRPLLVHVEAGLRSFDRLMPEEINRVVTDHISDLLFVTEESGLANLRNEGVCPNRTHLVGNTMIDSLLTCKDRAEESTILTRLGLRMGDRSPSRYGLLTLHRPSNVDNPEIFHNILSGLDELAADCRIVFPVHPRTRQRIEQFGLDVCSVTNADDSSNSHGLVLTDPLGYLDFLCLMKHASLVITDSGGIQEETTCLGVPCVTVRENTERPVTVSNGTNVVVGTATERIRQAIREQIGRPASDQVPKYWDGQAAGRILEVLLLNHPARIRQEAS